MRHLIALAVINIVSAAAVFALPGRSAIWHVAPFVLLSFVAYVKRNAPPLFGPQPGEEPRGLQRFGTAPPNIVTAYLFASLGSWLWLLVRLLDLIFPGCKPSCT